IPAPALPPATPAPAFPSVPVAAAVGDTVRYIDPETNTSYDGIVDAVDAAGQATVALDADRQFAVHVSTLTVIATAAASAPAPVVPAPTPAPMVPPIPAAQAAPAPAGATASTTDDELRGELLVIAKTFALPGNDLSSKEELVAELVTNEWYEGGDDGLNATEAATLRSVGITVTAAPPPPVAPAPSPPPPPPPPAPAPAPAPDPKPKAAKKKKKAKRKKRA
ncbi:hypothetical protein LCGC14_2547260, partial [marine sediment metagenome]